MLLATEYIALPGQLLDKVKEAALEKEVTLEKRPC
jgi:hypothetical protein